MTTTTTTHYLRFKHCEDEAQHFGVTFTVLGNGNIQVAEWNPCYDMGPGRIMPVTEARNLWRKMTTEPCECYGEPPYEPMPAPRG